MLVAQRDFRITFLEYVNRFEELNVVSATSVDALCACYVVTSVLKQKSKQFRLTTLEDTQSQEEAVKNQEFSTGTIFVGFGFRCNLSEKDVLVLDCEHPVKRENVCGVPRLFVLNSADEIKRAFENNEKGFISAYQAKPYKTLPAAYTAHRISSSLSCDSANTVWAALTSLLHCSSEIEGKEEYEEALSALTIECERTTYGKRRTQIEKTKLIDSPYLPYWTLYNSLLSSLDVFVPFETFKGSNKLDSFLAKIGISLKKSRESFPLMRLDAKNEIVDHIERYTTNSEIKIVKNSFVLHTRSRFEIKITDFIGVVNTSLHKEGLVSSLALFDSVQSVAAYIERAREFDSEIIDTMRRVVKEGLIVSLKKFRVCTVDIKETSYVYMQRLYYSLCRVLESGNNETMPLLLAGIVDAKVYYYASVPKGKNLFGPGIKKLATKNSYVEALRTEYGTIPKSCLSGFIRELVRVF